MIKDERMGEWLDALASKEAAPGGGSAAAAAGAQAASLGRMVANLTIGRKKYADVEDKMKEAERSLNSLQLKMLSLSDDYDKEMKRKIGDTEKETHLLASTRICLDIMETTGEIIDLLDQIGDCGRKKALPDAAIAAQSARTALLGAAMIITVNSNAMQENEETEKICRRAKKLADEYSSQADALYERIIRKISDIRE